MQLNDSSEETSVEDGVEDNVTENYVQYLHGAGELPERLLLALNTNDPKKVIDTSAHCSSIL